MEYRAVRNMLSDLAMKVLWNLDVAEASGDTAEHHIHVWKDDGVVKVEIRKVR